MRDVAAFFLDHAISDNVGPIANAHLALADASKQASLLCSYPQLRCLKEA